MKYKGGYKYQLHEMSVFDLGFDVGTTIVTDYITIINGTLLIDKGYCWDGATWFPDVKKIMRGSLAHDALYQLMREGLLPIGYRAAADKLLYNTCIEDKMWRIVAIPVYLAVRSKAAGAASAKNLKKVFTV